MSASVNHILPSEICVAPIWEGNGTFCSVFVSYSLKAQPHAMSYLVNGAQNQKTPVNGYANLRCR